MSSLHFKIPLPNRPSTSNKASLLERHNRRTATEAEKNHYTFFKTQIRSGDNLGIRSNILTQGSDISISQFSIAVYDKQEHDRAAQSQGCMHNSIQESLQSDFSFSCLNMSVHSESGISDKFDLIKCRDEGRVEFISNNPGTHIYGNNSTSNLKELPAIEFKFILEDILEKDKSLDDYSEANRSNSIRILFDTILSTHAAEEESNIDLDNFETPHQLGLLRDIKWKCPCRSSNDSSPMSSNKGTIDFTIDDVYETLYRDTKSSHDIGISMIADRQSIEI